MSGESAGLTTSPGPVVSLLRPVPGTRWPWLAAWFIALIAIGFLAVRDAAGPMIDLVVYRTGGHAILHGGNLYAIKTAQGLLFTYPPVSAVLAVPLALVPFSVAKAGWLVMIYGPLLFAVRTAFRPLLERAGQLGPVLFPVILAIAAWLAPVRQDTRFGQVDIFLLGICLLDCLAKSPKWPRGLLIGLATAIKLEPGAFIIYLLITRRWRDAGVAVLSFAGWTALAWIIRPHDSMTYWTKAIFDTSRLGDNESAGNQALRGIVLRLHTDVAPDLVWLPLVLIVGACGFAAARACWKQGHDMAGIAITGLLGALLSPVAWIHHLCWVLIAIAVVAGDGRSTRRIWAAVATGLLFLTTLPRWAEVHLTHEPVPQFVLENSFGLWALGLIVALFWIGAVRGRPESDDTKPVLLESEIATPALPLSTDASGRC